MLNSIQLEPLRWCLAIVFGGVLATVYFGGLWWTIHRLRNSRQPLATYFASLLARLTIVLSGLYVLIIGFPSYAFALGLAGFMITKWFLVRWLTDPPCHATVAVRSDR